MVYNHAFTIKKSLGETKKRKKSKDDDKEVTPEPQDDEETLKAHCALLEKECKKKRWYQGLQDVSSVNSYPAVSPKVDAWHECTNKSGNCSEHLSMSEKATDGMASISLSHLASHPAVPFH